MTSRKDVLKAEYARRRAIDEQIADHLAPWQRKFVLTKTRRKTAIAGRGSGKSVANGAGLLRAMLKWKKTRSLLLSITKAHAFETVVDGPGCLEDLADKMKVRLHVQRQDGRITCLDTESTVEVAGMGDWADVRKQRGKPNALAIIDEAGEHRSDLLHYTIKSVIEPRLGDPRYRDFSELWVTGTPGLICAGTWYKMTGDLSMPGWRVIRATARQNPHLNANEYFAEVLESNGWTEQSDTFRREYLAEWVLDDSVSIVRVPDDIFDGVPEGNSNWRHVVSSDYGVSPDPSALVLMRWSPTNAIIVVEKVLQRWEMSTSDMADTYRLPEWSPSTLETRVGDTGGGGKVYTHTMRKDHDIEVRPAKKDGKQQQLISMADRISDGRVKLLRAAAPLADELAALAWNDRRTDVHPTCQDHMSDALRYGMPFCSPAPPGFEEEPEPDPNDPDNWDWEGPQDDLDEVIDWIT